MDGNRRPNYDGCISIPVFLAPGDPYVTPQSLNLSKFFAGSRVGGLYAGKYQPKESYSGVTALSGGKLGPGCGAFTRTGPGMKAGSASTSKLPPANFSASSKPDYMKPTQFIDTQSSTRRSPSPTKRDVFRGHPMKNIGAGAGGAFSTFEHMPTTGNAGPKLPSTGPPWRTTHVKGRLFNKDTLPLVPGSGNTQMLDMKRYASGGRRPQFDDKHRSVQSTINKYPEYISDPYTDAHVEYTADGLYKGSKRRPFVTYQNKTRTAFADRSMPVDGAVPAVGSATNPATDD